jgi:hypothetical protein
MLAHTVCLKKTIDLEFVVSGIYAFGIVDMMSIDRDDLYEKGLFWKEICPRETFSSKLKTLTSTTGRRLP